MRDEIMKRKPRKVVSTDLPHDIINEMYEDAKADRISFAEQMRRDILGYRRIVRRNRK